MKKILFALCAVATFASCTKNEVVTFDQEAIAFDGAFVNNGTRAADSFTIETNELLAFDVWATTQRPGDNQPITPILNKVEVSRVDASSAWGYGTGYTQYWIPGNTYQFAAAKNYNAVALVNDVPATFDYDAAGQLDLLYAADTRVGQAAGSNDAVAFTFDHLLAKAYFTVNTDQMSGDNANYTYRISDVQINNAVKEAAYDVASKTWNGVSTYVVDFEDVHGKNKLAANGVYTSDLARLLVPVTYTDLNITCTIETLYGDAVIDVQNYDKTIPQTFVKGYVYNFVLALKDPGQPIDFTVVKVYEWVNDTINLGTPVAPVATVAELAAAVANGGNIRLESDLTLSGSEVHVAAGTEVDLDLNGHTLTVTAIDPIENNGKMTIANGEIVAVDAENSRRCIYNRGEMVIENMEFVQKYGAKGAAINNEGKMTIKSATVNSVYYTIWNSGSDAELTVEGGTFTCVGDNSSWKPSSDSVAWCYAVTNRNGAKMVVNGGTFVGNHGVIAAYEASKVTLNAGTYNCPATMTGNFDWVFYAYGEGSEIRYNAANCTLSHGVKPADACTTTEQNGSVVAF